MAKDTIYKFTDIGYSDISDEYTVEDNSKINNLQELSIGFGNTVCKMDDQGIWLGASKFNLAPFSVDMDGHIHASDADLDNYIVVGGAAGDINSNVTTINGGKITTNTIDANKIVAGSLIVGTNVLIGSALAAGQAANDINSNTTTINGGKITTNTIDANKIVAGSLIVGTNVLIGTALAAGQAANDVNSNTTTISGGKITTSSIDANKLNVSQLSSISANIGTITSGTITGVTVSSSSGNDRIELYNGDYIRFYAGNVLKAQLRGTSSGNGGLALSNGDMYLSNDKSFFIASSAGGSSEYGGMSITSGNQLWLTCGTANTFYLFNNAQTKTFISASTSSVVIGNDTNTLTLIPAQSLTQDLGDSSHIWDDVYCSTVGRQSGNAIWFDQAGRVQVDNHFDPSGAGSYSLGGSVRYWNDVSYKTLTDRGCLGWFDEGVELQDGRKVSDIDAIQAMQKHPTKKTIYGAPMLDYKTFPKVSYKPAMDRDGRVFKRDKKTDDPYTEEINIKTGKKEKVIAQDGIEMTSVFSIMIGAMKEMDNRLKVIEQQNNTLSKK